MVRHHLHPVAALDRYDPGQAVLPAATTVIQVNGEGSTLRFQPINPARLLDYRRRDRWVQQQDPLRRNIAEANDLASRTLDDEDVADLLAFLDALTDPTSCDLDHLVPAVVPSGLPVAD